MFVPAQSKGKTILDSTFLPNLPVHLQPKPKTGKSNHAWVSVQPSADFKHERVPVQVLRLLVVNANRFAVQQMRIRFLFFFFYIICFLFFLIFIFATTNTL